MSNILNLPQYHVQKVEETEHGYCIYAQASVEQTMCPHCHSARVTRWGAREILLKDVPMHGKRVRMYVRARRLRCDECGRTFQERLPALSKKRQMTERLARWIGQQSLKRSFASIAQEVGVDEGTIRNVLRDYARQS